jgi:hypothetical protein
MFFDAPSRMPLDGLWQVEVFPTGWKLRTFETQQSIANCTSITQLNATS